MLTPTQIIVLRFVLGLPGTVPMAIGSGMIVDMFDADERGQSMRCATYGAMLGPSFPAGSSRAGAQIGGALGSLVMMRDLKLMP